MSTSAGRFDEARAAFQSARELSERAGNAEAAVRATLNLADAERAAGRVEQAVAIGEALIERLCRGRPSPDEFLALANLLGALLEASRLDRAREVTRLCATRFRHTAEDSGMWSMLDTFGLLHAMDGRPEAAARLAGASDRAYAEHGQWQRQPNELADRERLDAMLTEGLSLQAIEHLKSQGGQLPLRDAIEIAFDVPN
jgi:tetratricopeptide (TPR) repeat protein